MSADSASGASSCKKWPTPGSVTTGPAGHMSLKPRGLANRGGAVRGTTSDEGIHDTQPFHTLRMPIGDRAADGAAPILHDQRDVGQVQGQDELL